MDVRAGIADERRGSAASMVEVVSDFASSIGAAVDDTTSSYVPRSLAGQLRGAHLPKHTITAVCEGRSYGETEPETS